MLRRPDPDSGTITHFPACLPPRCAGPVCRACPRRRGRQACLRAIWLGLAALLVSPPLVRADSWGDVPPVPTPRKCAGAASPAAGKLYVVGGEAEYVPNLRVYNPITNQWTTKASMPTPRQGLALTEASGTIYAIGGFNGRYLPTVEAYLPSTDTWVACAPMPTPRAHLGVAVLGGQIYAIGGYDGDDFAYPRAVEAYDPAADTWTVKNDLNWRNTNSPFDLKAMMIGFHAAVVVGGELYVGGGMVHVAGGVATAPAKSSGIFRYNQVADEWDAYGMLSVQRSSLAMVVLSNTIYAIGGDGSGLDALDSMDIFDPTYVKLNTPVAPPPMPTARTALAAGVINTRIFAAGGRDDDGKPVTALEMYEADTDTWSPMAPLPEKQSDIAAVGSGGRLYVLGGKVKYVAANEEYDEAQGKWSGRAPMGTPRTGAAVAAAGGKVYAIGGIGENGDLTLNEEYDPTVAPVGAWTTKAPLAATRRYAAGASAGGRIYAIGGLISGTTLASTLEYDPAADTWAVKAPMPTPRFLATATALGGKIYVFGGATSLMGGPSGTNVRLIYLDTAEVYDPATNTWAMLAPMPVVRAAAGSGSPGNGVIYVVGGINDEGSMAVNARYNPALDRWDIRAPLEAPAPPYEGRHGLAVGVPLGSTVMYAVAGERVRFGTGDAPAGFDSAGRWATSGTLFSDCEWYVADGATLYATVTAGPSPVGVPEGVTVTVQVQNRGDSSANGVTSGIAVNAGTGIVSLTGGPAPAAPVSLTPGESVSIGWTYVTSGAGEITWSATATGTDAGTGSPHSVLAWTSAPLAAAFRARLDGSLSVGPVPLVAGQIVTVHFTVTASGGATAFGVVPTLSVTRGAAHVTVLTAPFQPPTLALPGAGGSATTFTWTFRVESPGYVVFSAAATATDVVFGPISISASRSTQPSAPTGLAARQGDGTAMLTWNPNPAYEGVSLYRIYRGVTPDFTPAGAPVGTAAQPAFTDTGLANGVTYYYRIVAVNADGEGAPSAGLGVIPIRMPAVPGEVRITSTGSSPLHANPMRGEVVQVLINVPSGVGSLKLTVYTLIGERVREVYRGAAPPGPVVLEWNGRNDKDRIVASGGYLLVAELPDGKRVVKKVAILK